MSDETYTLKRIRDQVSNYIRDDDPAIISLIDDLINVELQKLARSRDWKELEVVNSFNTISSVAGQGYLALPGDCVQVKQISDRTNEIVLLNKNTLDMIQDDLERFATNGTPIFYTELGLKATKAPLSVDDTLNVTASSATDDGKRIRIKVLIMLSRRLFKPLMLRRLRQIPGNRDGPYIPLAPRVHLCPLRGGLISRKQPVVLTLGVFPSHAARRSIS